MFVHSLLILFDCVNMIGIDETTVGMYFWMVWKRNNCCFFLRHQFNIHVILQCGDLRWIWSNIGFAKFWSCYAVLFNFEIAQRCMTRMPSYELAFHRILSCELQLGKRWRIKAKQSWFWIFCSSRASTFAYWVNLYFLVASFFLSLLLGGGGPMDYMLLYSSWFYFAHRPILFPVHLFNLNFHFSSSRLVEYGVHCNCSRLIL